MNLNPNQITNFVDDITQKYIVKPLGGLASSGVNGFVFDVVGDEEMHLDADITDHYVEDNYTIQDHIALRPEKFVLKGFHGELSDIFPNAALKILTQAQVLSPVDSFMPGFTEQATKIYSEVAGIAAKVGQVINQAQSIYDIFTQKSTTATRQQNAYKIFYEFWHSRTLCDVETPFGILEDMAIESVRVVQRDQNRFITDFQVTFKRIRVAKRNIETAKNAFLESIKGVTSFKDRFSAMTSSGLWNGPTTGNDTLADGTSVSTNTLKNYYDSNVNGNYYSPNWGVR